MLVNKKPFCIQLIFTGAQRDLNTDEAKFYRGKFKSVVNVPEILLMREYGV